MAERPSGVGLDEETVERGASAITRWRRMLAVPQPQATDRVEGEAIESVIAREVLGASGLPAALEHHRRVLEELAAAGAEYFGRSRPDRASRIRTRLDAALAAARELQIDPTNSKALERGGDRG